MLKGRSIGEIICLGAAALLAMLDAVLPAGKVVWMVGDTNTPVVPVIVLGLVDLALLTGAFSRWRPAPSCQPSHCIGHRGRGECGLPSVGSSAIILRRTSLLPTW
jgi:hypothetical protein